jgi:Carbohydrate family 9 binding domain-like
MSGVMMKPASATFLLFCSWPCFAQAGWSGSYPLPLPVPRLEKAPVIDGDLSEWKYHAFSDGVWDIFRVMHSPWYDPQINRLTDHGHEPPPEEDLNSRYYIAWDSRYVYLGAEVHDNVNDVGDAARPPKEWYYRDAVCWFIEAPRHGKSKKFGQGDNAFCFVADARRPAYGAWWRHGTADKTYVEEPAPKASVTYALRMDPWKTGKGDFILEARVEMASTLGKSDPDWRPPKIGDEYGLEIVHTDPDGAGYGGHLIIYGNGDDDATWGRLRLVGPLKPVERKKN